MSKDGSPRFFLSSRFYITAGLLVLVGLVALSFFLITPPKATQHPGQDQQAPDLVAQETETLTFAGTPTGISTLPTVQPTPNATQPPLTAEQLYQQLMARTPDYASRMEQPDTAKWAVWQSSPEQWCLYKDGVYQAGTHKGYTFCQARALTVANFAVQLDLSITSPDSRAGMMYRGKITDGHWLEGYWLQVDLDGDYWIQTKATVLKSGSTRKWQQGVGQKNTLMLIVRGSKSVLFLNGILVGEIEHTAFTQGNLAFSSMGLSSAATIRYENVRLWTLS